RASSTGSDQLSFTTPFRASMTDTYRPHAMATIDSPSGVKRNDSPRTRCRIVPSRWTAPSGSGSPYRSLFGTGSAPPAECTAAIHAIRPTNLITALGPDSAVGCVSRNDNPSDALPMHASIPPMLRTLSLSLTLIAAPALAAPPPPVTALAYHPSG